VIHVAESLDTDEELWHDVRRLLPPCDEAVTSCEQPILLIVEPDFAAIVVAQLALFSLRNHGVPLVLVTPPDLERRACS
jgi:hypothetical protein